MAERIRYDRWILKQIALAIYSNGTMKCKHCGCDDIDCLDVDHINGGGSELRKTNPYVRKNHYYYLKSINYPDGHQILCKNCNWKKRLENTKFI